ncbi:MAG TPA: glycosyltransferase [Vicinamibacterales bacterium]|nr:glycosyltransferase [Vicinamibacterales bacterium]
MIEDKHPREPAGTRESGSRLTVGITTRNRPEALRRCLASLSHIAHLAPEVLVFDDASEPPATAGTSPGGIPVRVIRDERHAGNIAGRNRLVREAVGPSILLLDDDAALIEAGAVERGLAVLESDAAAAAIAYAQADRAGAPWPAGMQPAAFGEPCVVPAFIGFAHMVRRGAFLELGGYRERYEFYGEEKDFCLRLVDAGYRTVYLPAALVMHDPDPGGRSPRRYLRYVTRNDCLYALYNEPLARVLWLLPARLILYFVMRREWKISDPFGWLWVLRELWSNAPSVLRERRPVGAPARRRWSALQQAPEVYEGA